MTTEETSGKSDDIQDRYQAHEDAFEEIFVDGGDHQAKDWSRPL